MKRALYDKLLQWKSSPRRKPLILQGARQVGKTWLLQEFGRNEYDNVAYVNFHSNMAAQNLFRDFNTGRILTDIAAITRQTITPGRTLVILDEVQEARGGVAVLKYFCEDAREQHVAVAGSLLGISNLAGQSYPVGKVDTMRLYPMTFGEFLMALGYTQLHDLMASRDWEVLAPLHTMLNELLRQYYFVGGMPEVVMAYAESHDPNSVRQIQRSILDAYEQDFAKHAGNETQRIRMVWDSVPSQLARENKKFIFGAVKKGARAATLEDALQWLKDAGLTHHVERCRQPAKPLKFYADRDAFKVYVLDVGLLGAMTHTSPADMLVRGNVFTEFKGAFAENYVLQQLLASGNEQIYYFTKENSTIEIDFLLQTDERVIPIEVKAEENVKAKSLRTFVNTDHADKHFKAIRFSMLPYIDQGWMENIPLWAAGHIAAN